MSLRAGYYGLKKGIISGISDIIKKSSGAKWIKSIGAGLSLSDVGEISLKTASSSQLGGVKVGKGLEINDGVLSAATGTDIITVERSGSTSAYAWLVPEDAEGNELDPTKVTIVSLIGVMDMTGSPPYLNGYSVQIDLNSGSPRYACKLLNSQTNAPASDGTYNVTYRVSYIPMPAVTTTNNSRSKKANK